MVKEELKAVPLRNKAARDKAAKEVLPGLNLPSSVAARRIAALSPSLSWWWLTEVNSHRLACPPRRALRPPPSPPPLREAPARSVAAAKEKSALAATCHRADERAAASAVDAGSNARRRAASLRFAPPRRRHDRSAAFRRRARRRWGRSVARPSVAPTRRNMAATDEKGRRLAWWLVMSPLPADEALLTLPLVSKGFRDLAIDSVALASTLASMLGCHKDEGSVPLRDKEEVTKAFPSGRFLAAGGYKRVYAVLNEAQRRWEAMSVLDIKQLPARRPLRSARKGVGGISPVCSRSCGVAVAKMPPLKTRLPPCFQSSMPPPEDEWGAPASRAMGPTHTKEDPADARTPRHRDRLRVRRRRLPGDAGAVARAAAEADAEENDSDGDAGADDGEEASVHWCHWISWPGSYAAAEAGGDVAQAAASARVPVRAVRARDGRRHGGGLCKAAAGGGVGDGDAPDAPLSDALSCTSPRRN